MRVRVRSLQIVAGVLLFAAFVGALVRPSAQSKAPPPYAAKPAAKKQRAALTGAKPAPFPNFASKITKSVTKSGNWSDPTIWPNGALPVDGDSVGIPAGMTVVYDVTASPRLNVVDVMGTLDFGQVAAALDLKCATLIGEMGGKILGGDCVNNKQLAGTLTVTITDTAIDTTFDPGHFGTGVVIMCPCNMCGSSKKLGNVKVATGIPAGATSFTTADDLSDWNDGDLLLIPGLTFSPIQDELIPIKGQPAGGVVTLARPTQFSHVIPQPTQNANTRPAGSAPIPLAVGNLTRRITFQSENINGTPGHFMLMKDMNGQSWPATLCHITYKNFGRTDKSRPVTDPMVDASGVLVPGTDTNVRARYACHSHRTGPNGAQHTWEGLVCWCDPVTPGKGWGFDNHDSNVLASQLVSYNFFGSCAMTERGTELGTYANCLFVRTVGSGEDQSSRLDDQDFAHNGFGVWMQGPGVYVTGNHCYGHADSGIQVFTSGINFANPNNLDVISYGFPGKNLLVQPVPNQGWIDPAGNVLDIRYVPLFGLNNNVCVGCKNAGLGLDWTEPQPAAQMGNTKVSGNISINCLYPLYLNHIQNVEVDNPVCLDNYAPNSVGINTNIGYTSQFTIINPHVEGSLLGIPWPLGAAQPNRTIQGGYWANQIDFDLQDSDDGLISVSRINQLTGSPIFGPTPFDAQGSRLHYRMNFNYSPTKYLGDPKMYWIPLHQYLPNGQEIFFKEQDPAFVPLPATGITYPAGFPMQLVGLTNQQLFNQFGLCLGGALANKAPGADPLIQGGIIGTATPNNQYYLPVTPNPASLTNYLLVLEGWQPQTPNVPDPAGPITLQPGLNLLTRSFTGVKSTYFVTGSGTPPPPPPPPPVQVATTTTPTSAAATITLSLSATVTAANGATVNEGTVTFTVAGVGSVSAPVTAGVATATLAVPAAQYVTPVTVSTSYSGGPDFTVSTGTASLSTQSAQPMMRAKPLTPGMVKPMMPPARTNPRVSAVTPMRKQSARPKR